MNFGTVDAFVQHSHSRLSATLLVIKRAGGPSADTETLFLGVILNTLKYSDRQTITASAFFGVLEECAFLIKAYLRGALAMLDPEDTHERMLIARINSLSSEIEQLRQRRRVLAEQAVKLGFLSKTKNEYTVVRVP